MVFKIKIRKRGFENISKGREGEKKKEEGRKREREIKTEREREMVVDRERKEWRRDKGKCSIKSAEDKLNGISLYFFLNELNVKRK